MSIRELKRWCAAVHRPCVTRVLTFESLCRNRKKKFHKLSLRLHPDRNPDDKDAVEKFQSVNVAHACLSDAAKRAATLRALLCRESVVIVDRG